MLSDTVGSRGIRIANFNAPVSAAPVTIRSLLTTAQQVEFASGMLGAFSAILKAGAKDVNILDPIEPAQVYTITTLTAMELPWIDMIDYKIASSDAAVVSACQLLIILKGN